MREREEREEIGRVKREIIGRKRERREGIVGRHGVSEDREEQPEREQIKGEREI